MPVFNNKILHYILSSVLIAGCATSRADVSVYPPSPGKTDVTLFGNVEYDAQGRPVFNKVLSDRPSGEGDQFVLVEFMDNRPVRSFDIAVMSNSAEVFRPFRVIYEWTGRGFKTGLSAGKAHVDSVLKDRETNTLTNQFGGTADALRAVGPVILYSVGGFIVGLAASIPATFQELAQGLVISRETVLAYTVYEYDFRQRLSRTKTYLPASTEQEIIRADYYYTGDDVDPYKAAVKSYPENKERYIP